jgi:hypothetical protein
MSDPIEQGTRPTSQLLFMLQELVEALDRRRPQIELKRQAQGRIAKLE